MADLTAQDRARAALAVKGGPGIPLFPLSGTAERPRGYDAASPGGQAACLTRYAADLAVDVHASTISAAVLDPHLTAPLVARCRTDQLQR